MLLGTKSPGASGTESPRDKPNLYRKAPVSCFVMELFLLMCLSRAATAEPQGTRPQAELTSQLGEFSPPYLRPLDHPPDSTGLEAFSPPLASTGPNFSLLAPCMKPSTVMCHLQTPSAGLSLSFPPCHEGLQEVGCGDVGAHPFLPALRDCRR